MEEITGQHLTSALLNTFELQYQRPELRARIANESRLFDLLQADDAYSFWASNERPCVLKRPKKESRNGANRNSNAVAASGSVGNTDSVLQVPGVSQRLQRLAQPKHLPSVQPLHKNDYCFRHLTDYHLYATHYRNKFTLKYAGDVVIPLFSSGQFYFSELERHFNLKFIYEELKQRAAAQILLAVRDRHDAAVQLTTRINVQGSRVTQMRDHDFILNENQANDSARKVAINKAAAAIETRSSVVQKSTIEPDKVFCLQREPMLSRVTFGETVVLGEEQQEKTPLATGTEDPEPPLSIVDEQPASREVVDVRYEEHDSGIELPSIVQLDACVNCVKVSPGRKSNSMRVSRWAEKLRPAASKSSQTADNAEQKSRAGQAGKVPVTIIMDERENALASNTVKKLPAYHWLDDSKLELKPSKVPDCLQYRLDSVATVEAKSPAREVTRIVETARALYNSQQGPLFELLTRRLHTFVESQRAARIEKPLTLSMLDKLHTVLKTEDIVRSLEELDRIMQPHLDEAAAASANCYATLRPRRRRRQRERCSRVEMHATGSGGSSGKNGSIPWASFPPDFLEKLPSVYLSYTHGS